MLRASHMASEAAAHRNVGRYYTADRLRLLDPDMFHSRMENERDDVPYFQKTFFPPLKNLLRESIITDKGNIINDTWSWKKLAFDPSGIYEPHFDNTHLEMGFNFYKDIQ